MAKDKNNIGVEEDQSLESDFRFIDSEEPTIINVDPTTSEMPSAPEGEINAVPLASDTFIDQEPIDWAGEPPIVDALGMDQNLNVEDIEKLRDSGASEEQIEKLSSGDVESAKIFDPNAQAMRSDGHVSFTNPKDGRFYWVEKDRVEEALSKGLVAETIEQQQKRYSEDPFISGDAHINDADERLYVNKETNIRYLIRPEEEIDAKQKGLKPVSTLQVQAEEGEERYQRYKGRLGAFASGVGSSMTWGLSDVFGDTYIRKRLKEDFSGYSTAGELVGLISPTSAAGLLGRGGVRLATKLAAKEITNSALKSGGKFLFRKGLVGGAEGLGMGVNSAISDLGLGKESKNISKKIIDDTWQTALFSVGLGVAGKAIYSGAKLGKKAVEFPIKHQLKKYPEVVDKIHSLSRRLVKVKEDITEFNKAMSKAPTDKQEIIFRNIEEIKTLEGAIKRQKVAYNRPELEKYNMQLDKEIEKKMKELSNITKSAPKSTSVLDEFGRMFPDESVAEVAASKARIESAKILQDKIKGLIDIKKQDVMKNLDLIDIKVKELNIKKKGLENFIFEEIGFVGKTAPAYDLKLAKTLSESDISSAYSALYSKIGLTPMIGAAAGFAITGMGGGSIEDMLEGSLIGAGGTYILSNNVTVGLINKVIKGIAKKESNAIKAGYLADLSDTVMRGVSVGKSTGESTEQILKKMSGKGFIERAKLAAKNFPKYAAMHMLTVGQFNDEKEVLTNMDEDIIRDSIVSTWATNGMTDIMSVARGDFEKAKIMYLKEKLKFGRVSLSKAYAAIDLRGSLARVENGSYTKEDIEFMAIAYPKHFMHLKDTAIKMQRVNPTDRSVRKFINDILNVSKITLMATIQEGHSVNLENKKKMTVSGAQTDTNRIESKLGGK